MQDFIIPKHSLKILKERRQELRKNQTSQEKKLWFQIKGNFLGAKFRRQHSIGNYITDFYCPKHKLIIELDGSVHDTSEAEEYDEIRDQYLKDMNYKILRFTNTEVDNDIEKVIEKIKASLI